MGESDRYLWEQVLDLIITSSVKHPQLQRVIVANEDLVKEDWAYTFTSASNKRNIEFSMDEPKHWRTLTRPLSHWVEDGKFREQ